MNIRLPHNVDFIINNLENHGFSAYIVGGCVRDSLMGIPPHDWDICTSARPNEIKDCFAEFKTVDSGQKHGTIGIIIDRKAYEVTTFRKEGKYSDFRRPDNVSFTDSLKDDLSRRDFTINALAYSQKDGLFDFFGGLSDLKKGLVRCVGDAYGRFSEDALRMLRALRFCSELGFEIEKKTKAAIFENKHLLLNISKERINAEFTRLICGTGAPLVLRQYIDVIKVFIPQLGLYTDAQFEEALHAIEISLPDIVIRLFFLLKGTDEIARDILENLKYERKTIDGVCGIIDSFGIDITAAPKDIKRSLNLLGEKRLRQIILARCIEGLSKMNGIDSLLESERVLNDIISKGKCWNLTQLNINGDDIIALGVNEGEKIGKILNSLLMLVIDEEIENKKESLIKKARQMI